MSRQVCLCIWLTLAMGCVGTAKMPAVPDNDIASWHDWETTKNGDHIAMVGIMSRKGDVVTIKSPYGPIREMWVMGKDSWAVSDRNIGTCRPGEWVQVHGVVKSRLTMLDETVRVLVVEKWWLKEIGGGVAAEKDSRAAMQR